MMKQHHQVERTDIISLGTEHPLMSDKECADQEYVLSCASVVGAVEVMATSWCI
jgi:hypothetical protein